MTWSCPGCWPSGAWTGRRSPRPPPPGLPATAPVAVTLANRVVACSAAARAAGVRRGLRRRESQARCPQSARRHRRPGSRRPVLRAGDGRGGRPGAARRGAAARAAGAVGARGGPLLRVGIRCRRAAGRRGVGGRRWNARPASPTSCPPPCSPHAPGASSSPAGTPRFWRTCRSGELATEPSLSGEGRADLADLLWRLGIRTIGQFAALSRTDVASRFGADAVVAHRFARGEPERGPSGREPRAGTRRRDAV